MTNDLMTELQTLGAALATNLTNKGVTASYTDGLTTLANKILTIPQSGGHCYGVVFDSTSILGLMGTGTVGVTIYDNYSPVNGASLTLTGSDNSTYSATTNSNGYATFTVTGTINTTVTYSLTYQGITKTCTVQFIEHLFYDTCSSASGLTNYGTNHWLKGSTATLTMAYDSNHNAYSFIGNTVDGFADIPIPSMDGKDGYYIEAEFYTVDTSTKGQTGFVFYSSSDTGGNGVYYRDIAQLNRCGVLKFVSGSENGESGNSAQSSLPVGGNWYKLRVEVNGTSLTGKWMKTDNTLIYSHTYTIPSYTNLRVGLAFLTWNQYYYVKNIQADYL